MGLPYVITIFLVSSAHEGEYNKIVGSHVCMIPVQIKKTSTTKTMNNYYNGDLVVRIM